MKSKINCKSCPELANYLEELCTYFADFGVIPLEEGESIPLPGNGILRIRFDQNKVGGSIKIMLDW